MIDPSAPPDPVAAPRVLGQLLLAAGDISDEELRVALSEQRWTRERLGTVLTRNGTAPAHVAAALARQLRIPYLAGPLAPDPEVASLIDPASARRARLMPLRIREGRMVVAMEDPLDGEALDNLRFRAGRGVEPAVVTAGTLDAALDAVEQGGGAPPLHAPADAGAQPAPVSRHGVDPATGHRDAEEPGVAGVAPSPSVVALVENLLAEAWKAGASDVHVEPRRDRLLVRARVDGELRELLTLPAPAAAAVASRLKIMAGLDISVRRRPQDGRATVRLGERQIDLRVSTLPAVEGEKTVLRMLDPDHAGIALDALGLAAPMRARLDRILLRAHGSLLVTGPTGSGKTTTLYAVLGALDRERRNVVTLEDPIEYRLHGLTQVQVQPRSGLTFASALRAVLRQDPDVVMVGEMRDPETAEVGMAAALTGHLVLSTLHTNDAASAVSRLVEMGIPPYMVAGGLSGVLAQRLVRRLCNRCRAPAAPDRAALRSLGLPGDDGPIYEAPGCQSCGGRGYRGRTGIFDLLEVGADVRGAILARSGPDALRQTARRAGARGLAAHAWERLRAGETSLKEVGPFLALMASEGAPAVPDSG